MTESAIDMGRAMQGIDCEAIIWTNCGERMPPRSTSRVFYRNLHTKDIFIAEAIQSHVFMDARDFEWTQYTPEALAELSALDKKWLDGLPEFLKRQAD